MDKTNELLDMERRLKFIETLATIIDEREESQVWRLPLLWRQLAEEIEMLQEEVQLLEATW